MFSSSSLSHFANICKEIQVLHSKMTTIKIILMVIIPSIFLFSYSFSSLSCDMMIWHFYGVMSAVLHSLSMCQSEAKINRKTVFHSEFTNTWQIFDDIYLKKKEKKQTLCREEHTALSDRVTKRVEITLKLTNRNHQHFSVRCSHQFHAAAYGSVCVCHCIISYFSSACNVECTMHNAYQV